jgi:DNA-damage-inducible protein D
MADITKSDSDGITFEDFRQENGSYYWWASDLMQMLDYKDMQSFKKIIDRATKTFITLGINHYDNIIAETREIDGKNVQDFKLTRFACYLVVINGDPKKEPVAKAQVYFAEQTRKFEVFIQNSDELERLLIRDEIKDGHTSLASTAKRAGVYDYAKFSNAGFLGLYNMHNFKLAKTRNIDPKKIYDFMGRTELAANLFRITQTEERIKNFNIQGQENLEQTHYKVGREVREIVITNTGKSPESLPLEKEIPKVKSNLKAGYKKMLSADKKDKEKKKKEK